MKFDLFIDGKSYTVELDVGKVITVEVEGKPFPAEVKKTSEGMTVRVDNKEFLVQVEGSQVSINDTNYEVEVRNLRRGRPSWYYTMEKAEDVDVKKPTHTMYGGEGVIHPPMPGRVVSIKVKKGDSVKSGTPILVLEAMKMLNEICSTMDGVVREIRVSEGDLVESGDALAVIGN